MQGALAAHFPGYSLHRAAADATLSSDLQHALAGPQLTLDSLFKGWVYPWPAKLLAASTARFSPALTRWLGEEPDPADLMRPFPAEPMRMWPISTRVNKPENDDPSVPEPIGLIAA
jgi:hypothetical protein